MFRLYIFISQLLYSGSSTEDEVLFQDLVSLDLPTSPNTHISLEYIIREIFKLSGHYPHGRSSLTDALTFEEHVTTRRS